MTKCKQCQIEYTPIRKTSFFCSDKCRSTFNRKLANGELANDSERVSEREISKEIKEMDAQMLYACIGSYPRDTWKDSPEYGELLERLKNPVSWLRERGYFIPSYKYA